MDKIIDQIFDYISTEYAKEYLKRIQHSPYRNLSLNQTEYLNAIRKHYKVQVSELANELEVTKASVSVMVKKLIDLGLLTKEVDKDDKRVSYISLTKAALDFLDIDKNLYKEIIKEDLKKLDEMDIEDLVRIGKKLM